MPKKKGQSAAAPTETNTTAPEVPDHLLEEIADEAAPVAASKPPKKTAKAAKKEDKKEAKPETEPESAAESDKTANLDDEATEQAVNEIAVDESDTILTLQDVANEPEEDQTKPANDWPVLIVVLIILLVTIFFTRQDLVDFYRTLSINF